jgi:hypothetical protein
MTECDKRPADSILDNGRPIADIHAVETVKAK